LARFEQELLAGAGGVVDKNGYPLLGERSYMDGIASYN
jgi:hypothetical protein